MGETSDKPHWVFVHGASHGGWCWYKIRSLLEASGHKVTCLDLKGAGIDLTDPNTVFTSQDYNEPLTNFLSDLPDHERVILIGHSAAGATLTEAICSFAHKISMAIYIAADMVKPGSTYQEIKDMDQENSEKSIDINIFEFIYGSGQDQPPTAIIMKKEFQREYYYNLSPQEDSFLASMLLRPAPVRALKGTSLPATPGADSVPRVYMKTMHDRMLMHSRQDTMIRMWPPSQVFELESDHCPFFSTPTVLFDFLVEAAAANSTN